MWRFLRFRSRYTTTLSPILASTFCSIMHTLIALHGEMTWVLVYLCIRFLLQDVKVPCSEKVCELHVQNDPNRSVANLVIVSNTCHSIVATLCRRWSDNATNEVQTPNFCWPILWASQKHAVTSRASSPQSSPDVAVSVLSISRVAFVLRELLIICRKQFFCLCGEASRLLLLFFAAP